MKYGCSRVDSPTTTYSPACGAMACTTAELLSVLIHSPIGTLQITTITVDGMDGRSTSIPTAMDRVPWQPISKIVSIPFTANFITLFVDQM